MAKSSDSSGGFPLNLTAILALLTVAGGILYVTRTLVSQRPDNEPWVAQPVRDSQAVEARLWEDPFYYWSKKAVAAPKQPTLSKYIGGTLLPKPEPLGKSEVSPLHKLVEEVKKRVDEKIKVQLLPVMVVGGFGGDYRESRIRSRFAMVSALGKCGYVPEQSEHIGMVEIPLGDGIVTRAAFEWNRKKTFQDSASISGGPDRVLMLWLNEDDFEEKPAERLASGLKELLVGDTRATVIGPRFSHTLRAMLPEYGKEDEGKRVEGLERISLFMATPNAMDEVLVKMEPQDSPRHTVIDALKKRGFPEVRNFATTDRQLAAAMFDELKLRKLKLEETGAEDHIAIISEWDSFYGRMMNLTFSAELAVRQGLAGSHYEYVAKLTGENALPKAPENIHGFTFLRGLDGRSLAVPATSKREPILAPRRPNSLQDIHARSGDGNRAEGPAQFDYLGRLGTEILALHQEKLRMGHRGIRAVGIVGGDAYDTLLLLQALRPQLPDAWFFTTQLDARFWHPEERSWTRNLLVAADYGLRLDSEYMMQIPPFRDARQTAQYCAALAALGLRETGCIKPSPRRFEISRNGYVDLSKKDEKGLHPSRPKTPTVLGRIALGAAAIGFLVFLTVGGLRRRTFEFRATTASRLQFREEDIGGVPGFRLVALALAGRPDDRAAKWLLNQWNTRMGSTLPDITLQRGDIIRPGQVAEALRTSSDPLIAHIREQLGRRLLRRLMARRPPPPDEEFALLWKHLEKWFNEPHPLPAQLKTSLLVRAAEELQLGQEVQNRLLLEEAFPGSIRRFGTAEEMQIFLDFLNRLLEQPAIPSDKLYVIPLPDVKLPHSHPAFPRQVLGALLTGLTRPAIPDKEHAVAKAAAEARHVAVQEFLMNHRTAWFVGVGAAVFAAVVVLAGATAWWDTYGHWEGEPFSLTTGTSAWPAIFLRILAAGLGCYLIVWVWRRLRTNTWEMTRSHRLALGDSAGAPLDLDVPTGPPGQITRDAGEIWREYERRGRLKCRFWRMALMAVPYLLLCFALLGFPPHMLVPVRGPASAFWESASLVVMIAVFLVLTFGTIDAIRLCGWFSRQLSESPTSYPAATRFHYLRLRGGLRDPAIINEWLDLKLISERTEAVGRLIYGPFILFFIMLLARNYWWDRWTWPWALILLFVLNLVCAAVGALLLRRIAHRARQTGLESLQRKIEKLESNLVTTPKEQEDHEIAQARKLVEEMKELKTGAFSPFWESSVLGALLVPSGGTAAIEIFSYLMGR